MNNPKIIKKFFDNDDYKKLQKYLQDNHANYGYDESFGRYTAGDGDIPEFQKYIDIAENKARKVFNSPTLKHTYSLFAHYERNASLYKHKDDNACTYTLDLCLYQNEPWDLWVEGTPYCLKPNQALAYYGNDQLHWREEFPNPTFQQVAMIFFHFAEPDHWFFQKGRDYVSVARGQMSEKEWEKNNE